MTRTTQEWKQLLDEATPGPWGVDDSDEDAPEIRAAHAVGASRWAVTDGIAENRDLDVLEGAEWVQAMKSIHLAAAAPEAVAEVIRLRRELEQLGKFVENFPLQPLIVGTGSTAQRAFELQGKVHSAVTHILNPELAL